MSKTDASEIREQLESELGHEVSAKIWDQLCKRDSVANVMLKQLAPSALVEQVRELMEQAKAGSRSTSGRRVHGSGADGS